MPKGPPPVSAQRDCRFDHLVAAALAQGYGVVVVYRGVETIERGHEVRRGVYRCARHRGVAADAGPSRLVDGDAMGLHAADQGFELRFRLFTKHAGRGHVLNTYGPDRAGWAYDTRRPKNQDDIDYWAAQGLNEKGHRVR